MNEIATTQTKFLTSRQSVLAEIETKLSERVTTDEAKTAVRLIVGSFPNQRAHDAQVYLRQVSLLLASYPRCVVDAVTDPVSGVVVDKPFLPSLSEIKAFADARLSPLRRQRDSLATQVGQIARRDEPLDAETRKARADRLKSLRDQLGTDVVEPVAAPARSMPRPQRRQTDEEATAQLDRDRAETLRQCAQAGMTAE